VTFFKADGLPLSLLKAAFHIADRSRDIKKPSPRRSTDDPIEMLGCSLSLRCFFTHRFSSRTLSRKRLLRKETTSAYKGRANFPLTAPKGFTSKTATGYGRQ
jgi:hypothetical protein